MWRFFKKKQLVGDKKYYPEPVPSHIAIIMDGNARWAKSKNLPLQIGHKTGAENIRQIAEGCIELGVKYLTVYAFSSENWDRPQDEVNYLMSLLDDYLSKETKPLTEKGIKVLVSGDFKRLSDSTRSKISYITNLTKDNKSLLLNIAFSYGSRHEIVDAVKRISSQVSSGVIDVDSIDEDLISANLYSSNIPDPDLLIRTAGDFRVSNFLLWQIAYCELYFTKTYWPDFTTKDLAIAIQDFNARDRRYGKR